MDEDDKQVFLAAAILLAAGVGQTHEAVDEKQVRIAVGNAHKLYAEVKRRHDEAFAVLPHDGVEKTYKQQEADQTWQR